LKKYKDGAWLKAKVVSGYRSGDGCVSFIVDSIPESNSDKGPWGCGNAVPVIILEWEYKFFILNPDVWKEWREFCELRKYNGYEMKLPTLQGEEMPMGERNPDGRILGMLDSL
jgi:hypothetical protein